MFNSLGSKLQSAFDKISGRGILKEDDVKAVIKEVRKALLAADVNFKVAKDFCLRVEQAAIGQEVLKSLTPDKQVIKIVNEELTRLMGEEAVDLNLNVSPPAIIMLVGLQGSGKTTSAAKLAKFIRDEKKKKVLLVPADIYRPAAIDQLTTLGSALNIDVYPSNIDTAPITIAKDSISFAEKHNFDVAIIDTAGRLQIDEKLMDELQQINEAVKPAEVLLVADAMTGQEAVNVALGFNQALNIDGIILTKLDGDARGGAALSMKYVTNKPIKFIGVGEKTDALEVFHPSRMASRILGMGDVLSLIEKASKQIDAEEAEKMQKKLLKQRGFTLEDFLKQLRTMKKLGSISSIMGMVPGLSKFSKQIDSEEAEKELKKIEAIILSMTPYERQNHAILNGSRRKRIAKGAGVSVQDINRLLKQFREMQKIMKKLPKMNLKGLLGKGGINSIFKNI